MYNKCSRQCQEHLNFKNWFSSLRKNLFGVSEPKLTEKPPFTNPKNRKHLWLLTLYAIYIKKYIGKIHKIFLITRKKRDADFSTSLIITNAGDRNRTGTGGKSRRILSPVRLPVPPRRHPIWICSTFVQWMEVDSNHRKRC